MVKRRENGGRAGGAGGTLNFSSPHSPAYRKDERELCGVESTSSAILVQQQNIPLYFSFTSRVCILKISRADILYTSHIVHNTSPHRKS